MPHTVSKLKKLYDPVKGPMRVAGLMSGSGTNVIKIIEHQHALAASRKPPYEVVVIFTDNKKSNARDIAQTSYLPFECDDIRDFYAGLNAEKRGMSLRPAYFERVTRALEPYKPDLIVLGGFMRILTEPLLSAYLGINVHPADLSVTEGGKRKYAGGKAVLDQILAGEQQLRSSVHIVREKADDGEILVVSDALDVDIERAAEELYCEGRLSIGMNTIGLNYLRKLQHRKTAQMIANKHQGWLKEAGDWVVLPKAVEGIADGRFALCGNDVYFDGLHVPNGYRL